MKKVKVAAIQFDVQSGDKEKNWSKVAELLEVASREGANIVSFPYAFLTGSVTKEIIVESAESIPGPITNKLAELAKKYGVYIIGGTLIEKEDGKFYLTCPILGSDGTLVGKYRRTHTLPLPNLTPGTDYPVFKTKFGNVGVLVGGDIDFVEVARILALAGADIIFWIGALNYEWREVARFLTQATAWVSGCYVVATNRTGVVPGCTYYGDSMIVDMLGQTLASAGSSFGTLFSEGMAVALLDIEKQHKMRKQLGNLIEHRKPETYSPIVKRT